MVLSYTLSLSFSLSLCCLIGALLLGSLLPFSSCQQTTGALTQSQMQSFLDLHNWFRSGVSAADMTAVNWDYDLYNDAVAAASECPTPPGGGSQLNAFIPSNGISTQGDADYSVALQLAFTNWVDYGLWYDVTTNTCNGTSASLCHPYTQIVSNSVTMIGCAVAPSTCPNNAEPNNPFYAFVCQYNVAQNDNFAPYTPGIPCSECPGSQPYCQSPTGGNQGLTSYSGLCVDGNGILLVGQSAPLPNYFSRRFLSSIPMYVEIGVGFLAACILAYYAYLVRGWYLSGETKTFEAAPEGTGKYTKMGDTQDSSMSSVGLIQQNMVTSSTSVPSRPLPVSNNTFKPGGPPPLPGGGLPPNWQIHKDGQGRPYYYNTVTGASQWTVPK